MLLHFHLVQASSSMNVTTFLELYVHNGQAPSKASYAVLWQLLFVLAATYCGVKF